MRLDLIKKFKNFMNEIKNLNIKREDSNQHSGTANLKSNISSSHQSEHLIRNWQPTIYTAFKNEALMSKENMSNDMSSNNNYEDFYQNEGELFEIWSQNILNVNPIISYLEPPDKRKSGDTYQAQKLFGNIVNNIIIKMGTKVLILYYLWWFRDNNLIILWNCVCVWMFYVIHKARIPNKLYDNKMNKSG